MDPVLASSWQKFIDVITLTGGAVVFAWGFYQWGRAERWKRAERFDQLVREVETTPLLMLATQALDWSSRAVKLPELGAVTFDSTHVVRAMRRHRDGDDFPQPQALLRDAFDALLALFARLEIAIRGGLVEREIALRYFGYWIERYATLDRHAGRVDSAVEYAVAYSDIELVHDLFRRHPRWRELGKGFDAELARQLPAEVTAASSAAAQVANWLRRH